ncbi:MAG TPA: putative toxin-antitoxin system toxin component, PIN family [Candidatus Saccharimonadales bacterium]|nr:putative toxin-antitoxin system toxin component, PIN family [Candidatus Saccharimonadales bacterium]
MRVVYDTSVLVTLLSRRDQILKLKQAVSSRNIVIVISVPILAEVETVLSSKFGLTKQAAKSRTNLLVRVSEVAKLESIEKISRDSNDDMILATALYGKADYIVTLDEDLAVLKKYKSTAIITPTAFNKILG